ncbi:hypothetical protein SD70_01615 [Gordoniibacillus kamchatkensis]|uniref:DUF4871 domain-containing protein n=1 Tax=Gordoniibacillus kamchatkensis TaxID=1590651 RepID=A0ABR5AMM6_9BACL|nr:hypothetical protein [Paenibacillus sp. VKM B-2647]KIL42259.1 hypothetical protein SD70_01615 [Paenibacillus sp. VKM B-2647]
MRLSSAIITALLLLAGCESAAVSQAKTPSASFPSGSSTMVGSQGNIGILGPDFVAGKGNKYMWHFWGAKEELDKSPFRVEAINLETTEKTKALVAHAGTPQEEMVWEYDMPPAGPNNGADAHIPSSLKIPSGGLWRIDAYLGGKLKGSIVVDVKNR